MSRLGLRERAPPRAPPTAGRGGGHCPAGREPSARGVCHLHSKHVPAIIPSSGASSGPALSPGAAPPFVTVSRPLASAGGEGRARQDPASPGTHPVAHCPSRRQSARLLQRGARAPHKSAQPRHSDVARELRGGPGAPAASPSGDRQVGGDGEPHAWSGSRPLPFLCGFSLSGAPWNRRRVCRPESGGWFPPPDHSGSPSPVVKHRPGQGPIVRAMPPRFHLAAETSFCSASKESICSGRAGRAPGSHPPGGERRD